MQVSPIYNDPKYKCCCGTHVEKGAYIIAIVGTVLTGLSLLSNILILNYPAIKRRETWMYLPYLILTGIALVLLALLAIFLIVMAVVRNEIESAAIIVAVCIVCFSLNLWFYSVIYRAYKYMKDEQSVRVSPPLSTKCDVNQKKN
uniref:Lysosomal-associated transmembrane protein 4B n=1 Tax=Ditylenchus dipsaci TaxID=166011 RepID=A0A915CUB9_9BILA